VTCTHTHPPPPLQLVLMAMSENLVVVRHACAVISRLAGDVPTARKLLGHDVNSAIGALVGAGSQDAQMCGLGLLGNLAAASDVVAGELLTPAMMKRLQVCWLCWGGGGV
jgi:hypothetical protein